MLVQTSSSSVPKHLAGLTDLAGKPDPLAFATDGDT
jgi:hypothetical protein